MGASVCFNSFGLGEEGPIGHQDILHPVLREKAATEYTGRSNIQPLPNGNNLFEAFSLKTSRKDISEAELHGKGTQEVEVERKGPVDRSFASQARRLVGEKFRVKRIVELPDPAAAAPFRAGGQLELVLVERLSAGNVRHAHLQRLLARAGVIGKKHGLIFRSHGYRRHRLALFLPVLPRNLRGKRSVAPRRLRCRPGNAPGSPLSRRGSPGRELLPASRIRTAVRRPVRGCRTRPSSATGSQLLRGLLLTAKIGAPDFAALGEEPKSLNGMAISTIQRSLPCATALFRALLQDATPAPDATR